MNDVTGVELMAQLLISFPLTIIIEFLPYIIVRYLIIKRPLQKKGATLFTIFWAIICVLVSFLNAWIAKTSWDLNIPALFLWNMWGHNVLLKDKSKKKNSKWLFPFTMLLVIAWITSIYYSYLLITDPRDAETQAFFILVILFVIIFIPALVIKKALSNHKHKKIKTQNEHNDPHRINDMQTGYSSSVTLTTEETFKKMYNSLKQIPDSLNASDYLDLTEDFKKRAGNHYARAKGNGTVHLTFGGESNVFNGYLLCSTTGRVKDFQVLIFEKTQIPVHMESGDTLYYVHCTLNQRTDPCPTAVPTPTPAPVETPATNTVANDVERLTQLRKAGQLTEDEYLKLLGNLKKE